jgi:hypothetical protein
VEIDIPYELRKDFIMVFTSYVAGSSLSYAEIGLQHSKNKYPKETDKIKWL